MHRSTGCIAHTAYITLPMQHDPNVESAGLVHLGSASITHTDSATRLLTAFSTFEGRHIDTMTSSGAGSSTPNAKANKTTQAAAAEKPERGPQAVHTAAPAGSPTPTQQNNYNEADRLLQACSPALKQIADMRRLLAYQEFITQGAYIRDAINQKHAQNPNSSCESLIGLKASARALQQPWYNAKAFVEAVKRNADAYVALYKACFENPGKSQAKPWDAASDLQSKYTAMVGTYTNAKKALEEAIRRLQKESFVSDLASRTLCGDGGPWADFGAGNVTVDVALIKHKHKSVIQEVALLTALSTALAKQTSISATVDGSNSVPRNPTENTVVRKSSSQANLQQQGRSVSPYRGQSIGTNGSAAAAKTSALSRYFTAIHRCLNNGQNAEYMLCQSLDSVEATLLEDNCSRHSALRARKEAEAQLLAGQNNPVAK